MKDMSVVLGRRTIASGCFGCKVASVTEREEVEWVETDSDGNRTHKKEMQNVRNWKRDTTTFDCDPTSAEEQNSVRGACNDMYSAGEPTTTRAR
jgi:hypothetical protein